MEGLLREYLRREGVLDEDDSPLSQAQNLVYQAFQTEDWEARFDLARQALEISPDCVDAYVCIAELAPSPGEALPIWEQAVGVGERVLGGAEGCARHAGHFWGLIETRPYMRARLGLAQCLWSLRRREEAVAHCQDLLRLNPNDNQGVRYVLSSFCCELGQDDQWQQLLDQYPDDAAADWHFGRALLAYRRAGDTDDSRSLLRGPCSQSVCRGVFGGQPNAASRTARVCGPGRGQRSSQLRRRFLAGLAGYPRRRRLGAKDAANRPARKPAQPAPAVLEFLERQRERFAAGRR